MQSLLAQEDVLHTELSVVVKDLRQFLSNLQRPKAKDASWVTSVFQRSQQLESRIADLQKALMDRPKSVTRSMDEVIVSLRSYSLELTENANSKRLNSMYTSLVGTYEDFLAQLPTLKLKGIAKLTRTSHLKPNNYSRNLFHALSGVAAVLLYEFLLTKTQAIACLLVALAVLATLEIARRHSTKWNTFVTEKIFMRVSHPSERYRVTGSTYFLIAMTIITIACPTKPPVEIAVLILSIADPAASIAGRRWGKKKLYNNKSYVGTGAFFIVATVVAIVALLTLAGDISTTHAIAAAFVLACVGTAAELLSSRIDDNFSIPVVCAVAAFLLL